VAVRVLASERALAEEARLIARLRPRDVPPPPGEAAESAAAPSA
jgi:hypothetical protein